MREKIITKININKRFCDACAVSVACFMSIMFIFVRGEVAGASLRTGLHLKKIIGTDDRHQIINTTESIHRYIGQLELGCTGTLIGQKYVLTAAHCVYDMKKDEWRDNLKFTPAKNGSDRSKLPYRTYDWKVATIKKQFIEYVKHPSGADYVDVDYALIELVENVGDYVGFIHASSAEDIKADHVFYTAGYPGDKPLGTMWYDYCDYSFVPGNLNRIHSTCDTYGGQSGSPMFLGKMSDSSSETLDLSIYGLVNASGLPGDNFNYSTKMNHEKIENLKTWLKSEYLPSTDAIHHNSNPQKSLGYFYFHNGCHKDVSVAIAYKVNGKWETRSWFSFAAHEKSLLVKINGNDMLYYAKSKDGKMEWKGDGYIEVTGDHGPGGKFGYGYREATMPDQWPSKTVKITCNN